MSFDWAAIDWQSPQAQGAVAAVAEVKALLTPRGIVRALVDLQDPSRAAWFMDKDTPELWTEGELRALANTRAVLRAALTDECQADRWGHSPDDCGPTTGGVD